jgi:hypothetical protein
MKIICVNFFRFFVTFVSSCTQYVYRGPTVYMICSLPVILVPFVDAGC